MEITVRHETVGVPAAAIDFNDTADEDLPSSPTKALHINEQKSIAIAARKQTATDKKAFREWENGTDIKSKNENVQPGPSEIDAALGLTFLRSTRRMATPNDNSAQGGIVCHYGHQTTSSRTWLRNPLPSFWPGVASGVALCYRCYQIGYRHGPPPPFATDVPT